MFVCVYVRCVVHDGEGSDVLKASVCMYVCIHTYVYTHTCIRVYVCMCVCVYFCVFLYLKCIQQGGEGLGEISPELVCVSKPSPWYRMVPVGENSLQFWEICLPVIAANLIAAPTVTIRYQGEGLDLPKGGVCIDAYMRPYEWKEIYIVKTEVNKSYTCATWRRTLEHDSQAHTNHCVFLLFFLPKKRCVQCGEAHWECCCVWGASGEFYKFMTLWINTLICLYMNLYLYFNIQTWWSTLGIPLCLECPCWFLYVYVYMNKYVCVCINVWKWRSTLGIPKHVHV